MFLNLGFGKSFFQEVDGLNKLIEESRRKIQTEKENTRKIAVKIPLMKNESNLTKDFNTMSQRILDADMENGKIDEDFSKRIIEDCKRFIKDYKSFKSHIFYGVIERRLVTFEKRLSSKKSSKTTKKPRNEAEESK